MALTVVVGVFNFDDSVSVLTSAAINDDVVFCARLLAVPFQSVIEDVLREGILEYESALSLAEPLRFEGDREVRGLFFFDEELLRVLLGGGEEVAVLRGV